MITLKAWQLVGLLAVAAALFGIAFALGGLRSEESDPSSSNAADAGSLQTSATPEATLTVVDTPIPTPVACQAKKAAEEMRRSVVRMQAGTGIGTGLIVQDGVVVTNAHVVGPDTSVVLSLWDGQVVVGKVVAVDEIRDLAKVGIQADGIPTATFCERR